MGKRDKLFTHHHLLPQSRNGANIPRNIELLPDNKHRAIHQLFENQMIAEQLRTTINISSKALREDVKQWLLETLNKRDISDPYDWYDERVIRYFYLITDIIDAKTR